METVSAQGIRRHFSDQSTASFLDENHAVDYKGNLKKEQKPNEVIVI